MMEETRVDGAVVLKLALRRLDAAVAPRFREEALARVTGATCVVLDLSAVDFMDSTGLGCVVAVMKRLQPGGDLRLVGVGERVSAVLRLTRLDAVFRAFETTEQALAA